MNGRVVVVTGGSAGVGRAAAEAFARQGDRVAVVARDPERLDATVAELGRLGSLGTLAIPADVADAAAVDDAAAQVERELGLIDVWVNNAMTSVFARFMDVTADEFRRVNEVTYLGYVNGTRAALQRMLPRDRGVVVQVGSALAYRGIPLQAAYCGAKHAIQGFTESVRCELLHDGSKVELCQVHLPAVNTPQFDWVLSRLPRRAQPVPPIYQPEVAAEAIAFMADNPTRELWVGGTTVATLLANKVAPGVLDHYLGRTGVDGQQTDAPESPDRPANLWEPVPGPYGAHGSFDDEATATSPTLSLSLAKHRATAALRRRLRPTP
jgi:NAD(P)-dependent dehydrogenase (short-subunit alcohol dehydrogenase family)